RAASPVETLTKELFHGELALAHRDTVHKLKRGPYSVELDALIDVHDVVSGLLVAHPQRPVLLHELFHSMKNGLKDGQTTAKTFFGEQIGVTSDECLLQAKKQWLELESSGVEEEKTLTLG